MFFKRVIDVVIVVGCVIVTISSFIGLESIWNTILGGTAITTAVLTFVAQDTIKDLLGIDLDPSLLDAVVQGVTSKLGGEAVKGGKGFIDKIKSLFGKK